MQRRGEVVDFLCFVMCDVFCDDRLSSTAFESTSPRIEVSRYGLVIPKALIG